MPLFQNLLAFLTWFLDTLLLCHSRVLVKGPNIQVKVNKICFAQITLTNKKLQALNCPYCGKSTIIFCIFNMESSEVSCMSHQCWLSEYFRYSTKIYFIFNMNNQISLTPTTDVGHRNILVKQFSYSTGIFSVFNMDDRTAPTPAVGVGCQNILIDNCGYLNRIFLIFY